MRYEDKAIVEIVARHAIAELSYRYAHGIDRCDVAMLKSVWTPDATVDFGRGPEKAGEWSENIIAFLLTMNRTQHIMANILIAFDQDMQKATVETYVQAYHELTVNDAVSEMIMGGRYLDVVTCDAGTWRIAQRRFVLDWNSNHPGSAEWSTGIFAALPRRGGRAPDDPFYT